jgi:nitrogen-specific signal transduction histidine kinase
MEQNEKSNRESFKVSGDEILSKVKEIIKEGNARKIIIKNDKDETIMEFPLTIGAIGVVLAPIFAAVGALTALATHCIIIVEKRNSDEVK